MNLPIVTRDRSQLNAGIVHALRLGVIVTLAMLLPSPHGQSISQRMFQRSPEQEKPVELLPALEDLRGLHRPIDSAASEFDEQRLLEVFDDLGNSLGHVARTLPDAEKIVGYRGPTEAIILIDSDRQIQAVRVMGSHDTPEHVAAVIESPVFLNQFVGIDWERVPSAETIGAVDGVSGATLTSLAVARGIFKRMGAKPFRGVFSRPLSAEDAIKLFEQDAKEVVGDPIGTVRNEEGRSLGTLIRTGGLIKDQMGYQGPTELMIGLGKDQRINKVIIRESFDNEPYVSYLPQERSFFRSYVGKTLEELAGADSSDINVEGVSGATMTSVMVAEMIPRLAKAIQAKGGIDAWREKTLWQQIVAQVQIFWQSIRWSPTEVATLVILCGLPIVIRSGWMRRRRLRVCWLITVVMVIGLWSGNLVSLALLAGFVTSGISWAVAIGLAWMILVVFLLPATTKSNPYCNHLCPHGAAQQLIRPNAKSWRHRKLPSSLAAKLSQLPAILLVIAYLLLLLRPTTDISFVEPFHAYLWRISAWGTVVFALITLVISGIIPMGYCRYGCPTGSLLKVLRFKATSGKITTTDYVAIGLLVLATGVRLVIPLVD